MAIGVKVLDRPIQQTSYVRASLQGMALTLRHLLRPMSEDQLTWNALVHPGRKMRSGEEVVFDERVTARILGRGEFGSKAAAALDIGSRAQGR